MSLLVFIAAAFVIWQSLPVDWALAPATWAFAAAGAWTLHLLLRPRERPFTHGEQGLVLWGFASCLALLSFLESDPGFKVRGWKGAQACSCAGCTLYNADTLPRWHE